MSCVLERKAQIIFVTASSVKDKGKKRRVVIEGRPDFAVVKLNGSRERFPIAWELIYEIAKRHHEENLRIEHQADQLRKPARRKGPR
jgi:hypothetical protein